MALLALSAGCPDEDTDERDTESGTADSDCGATEVCDGVDNDCNGVADDAYPWYADADSDGYGDIDEVIWACDEPRGFVDNPNDCDDADPSFHPGAAEQDCHSATDYNCDGIVPFADGDADGAAQCDDCDDADAAVHPGAIEVCNGNDDDCDGVVDDGCS